MGGMEGARRAARHPGLDPAAYGRELFYRRVVVHGWFLSEFSARTGLGPNTIKQIELGKWLPNLESADRIADALGVPVEDLWRGDGSPAEFRARWDAVRGGGSPRWRFDLERDLMQSLWGKDPMKGRMQKAKAAAA